MDEAVAVATGFFNGEGCTYTANSHNGRYGYPRISIGQNDPEPLIQFQQAFGVGKVLKRGTLTSAGKEHWVYRCTQWRDVQVILIKMWPHLTRTKKLQARTVMMKFRNEELR